MGTALYFLGLIVMFVGGIWIIINAFKTSILWGLGSLFIPFVALIFAIMNWQQNKQAFFIWLAGFAIMIIGVFMGGLGSMAGMPAMPASTP